MSDLLSRAADRLGAHRITTRRSSRHIRVECDGLILADSRRAVELDEARLPTRYYLPREDVRVELLTEAETMTHCPFKGDATWYSAPGVKDAFWVYEDPDKEDALPVAGMLAPHPERVCVLVDGEPVK